MSNAILVNIEAGGKTGKCSMVLAKMWSLGNSSFSEVVLEEYRLVWGLGMN